MVDDHYDIINNLSPADALVILRQLAARDEKLAGKIAALGRARLSDVDMDEVARALRQKLESLEPEDIWERAGVTRNGYVETDEAAFELLEGEIQAFIEAALPPWASVLMPLVRGEDA